MRSSYPIKLLGDLIRLEYGKPLPESDRTTEAVIPAFGANGVLCWSRKAFREEPSIIVGRKGSAGEVNLTDGPFWPTDVTYFVEHDKRETDLRYLFYLLKFLELPKLAKGVKPGINRNDVYALPVPVPPLIEQKRIVAILDEAFEGIAKATANAERNLANARELFDNRVAVLFAYPRETWRRAKLSEVCDAFEYGTSAKSKKTGKIPVLRMGNIQSGALDWTDLVYANNEAEAARYELEDGDVLFNRTNSAEHVGKAAIFRNERKAIFAGYLIRIRYKRSLIDGEFLNFYLNSPVARTYGRSVMAQSVNQANISGSKLKEYPFVYPSIEEQLSISAELKELQAISAELADLYHKKIQALSELKKSILHKAFSGQLTGKEAIAA